ncbi:serine/threonine protein kinase, partial [Kineococcus sp. R8]|nr:serine/threonine protein kinase [Kineococcus siccus]
MTTTSSQPAHRQTQEFRTLGAAGRNAQDQGTTVTTSTRPRGTTATTAPTTTAPTTTT